MARITGGSVRYLRRVNTGNYEHKEFQAEISFSADEGEDASVMLGKAGDMAIAEAHYRLGIVERQPQRDPRVTTELVETRQQHNDDPNARHGQPVEREPLPDMPAKRRGPPKLGSVEAIKAATTQQASIPVEAIKAATTQQASIPVQPLTSPVTGGTSSLDMPQPVSVPPTIDMPVTVSPADELLPPSEADSSDDLLPPSEISNEDLHKAVIAKVKALGDGRPVRRVLDGYATQVAAIPQERRAAFLAAIEAL